MKCQSYGKFARKHERQLILSTTGRDIGGEEEDDPFAVSNSSDSGLEKPNLQLQGEFKRFFKSCNCREYPVYPDLWMSLIGTFFVGAPVLRLAPLAQHKLSKLADSEKIRPILLFLAAG